MTNELLVSYALSLGFSAAAVTKTENLTVKPEYRKYCEENLCGCYGAIPACPPQSGTVEEMEKSFRRYKNALVLQTLVSSSERELYESSKNAKTRHNQLSERVTEYMNTLGVKDTLLMSAGPYKSHSCMSAYCVDAALLAERVNMECWGTDGKIRYFSVILF